jgi:hypothetical protein
VSTSSAGLRRVCDGPRARILSFCSSTCMPRSGTRWRAAALGGTSEGPSGRRGLASASQAAPESACPGE